MEENVAGLVIDKNPTLVVIINLPIVRKGLFLKKEHEYSLALPTHNRSCFKIALAKTQYFTHLRSFTKKQTGYVSTLLIIFNSQCHSALALVSTQ